MEFASIQRSPLFESEKLVIMFLDITLKRLIVEEYVNKLIE